MRQEIYPAILARLTAGRPDLAGNLTAIISELPNGGADITRQIMKYSASTDLRALTGGSSEDDILGLLSADHILTQEFPEPIWAIPGLLPVGLAILAGAPKVGKSWLALQFAQSVASGGYALDQKVDKGAVLYLALEDTARRLKTRMNAQKWPRGLCADFMTLGAFYDQVGDLRNGGGEKLARRIEARSYRLVVIDTLSRAIFGDQQDVREMTSWLSPLQEIAHAQSCALVLIDHHRKSSGFEPDAIADILGSTAKGAMADTSLGLYRERGKPGARLAVTGRDVEEKTINLFFDATTSAWQVERGADGLTDQRKELLEVLEAIGPAGTAELEEATGRNRGNVYKQLAELEKIGKVAREGKLWKILPF